ncbi:hypothetical protein KEG38_20605 [Polyangium jinanense]|uniref:hypothetical protein n=1 Tax=Polyangium jinanense TaxID=2829994 RepID=UPI002340EF82|nr:hypothetical protein [Polyangium jinanense]MDC3956274.1 hypothetical protein [Polyangium jinanense]
MELSIKIEGKPIAEEPAPELGFTGFEGMPIAMAFPDSEPRSLDLELGRRLGYGRPREIRALIKNLSDGGFLVVDDQRGAAPRSPRTAEYWLTEEQALFVTTQSGTTRARAITLQLVRAFIAARHALNKPILDKDLVSPLEATLRRCTASTSRSRSASIASGTTAASASARCRSCP